MRKIEELLRYKVIYDKYNNFNEFKEIMSTLDMALKDLQSDYYYKIIEKIYLDGCTREEVAEYYNTTGSTITKNKQRLLDELEKRVLPKEYFSNIGYLFSE